MLSHSGSDFYVDPTGLEPATSSVQVRRSSQMSYGPKDYLDLNKSSKIHYKENFEKDKIPDEILNRVIVELIYLCDLLKDL